MVTHVGEGSVCKGTATPLSQGKAPVVPPILGYHLYPHSLTLSSSSSFLACNSGLRNAVCRPQPPQRPVLGHIHCFRQCEIVGSQRLRSCCMVLSHVMWGRPRGLLQSSGGRVDRILVALAFVIHMRTVLKKGQAT